jgi:hypothetical protein
LLKASDEQTVAALAALLSAMAKFDAESFDEWGIVAAPRFPGRAQLALALDSFAAEGVWGVSPHLIPHFALHSAAGTLSLALGIHGPNLGIGGGTDSALQGFLMALTWLDEGRVPGVWLILSGYRPEFIPGHRDVPPTDSECQALALALVPDTSPAAATARVRLVHGNADAFEEPQDLVAAAEWLESRERQERPDVKPSIYRPHIRFSDSNRPDVRAVAADPVSGLRVELAVSPTSADEEDSR